MSILFRPKEYVRAKSHEEVVETLTRKAGKALVLGGGTAIFEFAERGLLGHIETLIDLRDLALRYVKHEGDWLRIGAASTFTDLTHSNELRSESCFGALLDAALYIRPVQVTNVATVAGSICTSVPRFDFPTALLASDAVVNAFGQKGERKIEIKNFWKDFLQSCLESSEFVTEIIVPKPKGEATVSAFEKMEFTALDWAVINTAVRVSLGREGKVTNCRIALGGDVGPMPIRVPKAERLLDGQTPDEDVLADVVSSVKSEIEPGDDFRTSAEYKLEIAGVMVKRALKKAMMRAKAG